MNQLKRRIAKMIKEDAIKDTVEKEKIGSLLRNKKWNPYCLRHSSISSDSDYLLLEYTDFLLKTKVGVVKLHSEKSSNFKAVCEKFNEYTNREETA